MISIDELNAIKAKNKNNVTIRTDEKDLRVVVGMGNSGLVAGARDILHELVRLVEENDLCSKVLIMQEARASMPGHNPVVKIYDRENEIATYVNVTKETIKEIVEEHLIKGNIVQKYLYNNTEA